MRAVLVLLLLVAAGCALSPNRTDRYPMAPLTLAEAEARWQAAGLASYTLVYERSCFCAPAQRGPYRVTVEGGRAVRTEYVGREAPNGPIAEEGMRVEDFFALLREAYRGRAAQVRVSYDARDGHPLQLYIDRDVQMADEEIGYTLAALTPAR